MERKKKKKKNEGKRIKKKKCFEFDKLLTEEVIAVKRSRIRRWLV